MVKTVDADGDRQGKSKYRRADHGGVFAEEPQAVPQIEQPRWHGARTRPMRRPGHRDVPCRHETGEIHEQPRVRVEAPALAASKIEQLGDVGFDLIATLAQRHASEQDADDEWRAWPMSTHARPRDSIACHMRSRTRRSSWRALMPAAVGW